MILVTGATGFVGKPLCETLASQGYNVRQVTRDQEKTQDNKTYIDSIGSHTDWTKALEGVDTVIHLAARAHIIRESEDDPLAVFREVNTYGTAKLAKACIQAGVKRFIFLSSIGVNGNSTSIPFSRDSKPAPVTPYAISKFEAEMMIEDLCKNSAMDVVILRPPLIYGPQAKGNFNRILSAVQKRIPLPLGCIENKRTLVYIYNIIDLIIHIIKIKTSINDTFLVADSKSLSTKALVQHIASVLNSKQILIPVPVLILKFFGRIFGKSEEIQRLTNDLEVDTTYINTKLGWNPPFTPEEGLRETANWYKLCTK